MPTAKAALEGSVAVVTGGSRGIGAAIATRLGRLGAHVVVSYCADADAADRVVKFIVDAGGTAEALRADLVDRQQARALVGAVLERHDRVDVLVHNAAIQRSALLHTMSDADWYDVLEVNLGAAFQLCRAVLPSMRASGRGQIVLVASASSFMAQPGASSYVASKHALIGLTKSLALETAKKGIRVNAVAPGLTDTDLVRGLTAEQTAGLLARVPLGRMGRPDEVAEMVDFVITRAGYCTGNVFHVGGGVVMG